MKNAMPKLQILTPDSLDAVAGGFFAGRAPVVGWQDNGNERWGAQATQSWGWSGMGANESGWQLASNDWNPVGWDRDTSGGAGWDGG